MPIEKPKYSTVNAIVDGKRYSCLCVEQSNGNRVNFYLIPILRIIEEYGSVEIFTNLLDEKKREFPYLHAHYVYDLETGGILDINELYRKHRTRLMRLVIQSRMTLEVRNP